MNLVPVPKVARDMYPHATTQVMLPPDGNMTNDEIRAADVLLDLSLPGRRMFWTPDEKELNTIMLWKTVYFELAIFGSVMPPVSLIVWADGEGGQR